MGRCYFYICANDLYIKEEKTILLSFISGKIYKIDENLIWGELILI